jgi:phosphoglucomutase
MAQLRTLVEVKETMIGKTYTSGSESFTVADCGDFAYTDPVDASVSLKQGIFIVFADGSRIVFRASGTGSSGATIRVYIERYEGVEWRVEAREKLAGLVEIAQEVGRVFEFTGRKEPTVIT